MVFISATRLRVKSFLYLFSFFRANEVSVKKLLKTPGFIGGLELIDKKLTFWTLTMWNADADMKEFRNSLPHRKAMQKLPYWCDEASYVHWVQNEDALPGWDIVYEKLIAEGKITKVRLPSPNHLSKNYPAIKWKRIQREFKPSLM